MSDTPLPVAWLWTALAVHAVVLFAAVRLANWARLREPGALHLFLGATVSVLVVWSIRGGLPGGPDVHLLGLTTVTLMFGWPLAVISVSLVEVGLLFNDPARWPVVPLQTVVQGLIPVSVSRAVLALCERWLPSHFFVYVFVAAFAGGALAMVAGRMTEIAVLAAAPGANAELVTALLPYVALMAFPEAVLNGMLVTLLVAYKPGWVATFDDARYLKGK